VFKSLVFRHKKENCDLLIMLFEKMYSRASCGKACRSD
jgi:hypothetical protein